MIYDAEHAEFFIAALCAIDADRGANGELRLARPVAAMEHDFALAIAELGNAWLSANTELVYRAANALARAAAEAAAKAAA